MSRPKWTTASPPSTAVPDEKENHIARPSTTSPVPVRDLDAELRPKSGGETRRPASAASAAKKPAAPDKTAPARPGRKTPTPTTAASRPTRPSTTASSSRREEREVTPSGVKPDPARFRAMIATLHLATPKKQPFSSADFYTFGRTIGQGAYGQVTIGTQLLTSEKVAVKTFEKTKLADPTSRKRVAREIRILKALSHPNVIKLLEVIDCPSKKYLIMEFAPGGDLCKYVREARRLKEPEACRLFCQIVDGLLYCHNAGIVHRDVKLDNILMDADRNIKIVDFGFSVNFREGQKLRKACGSPSYAAPEIVSRKPYNPPMVDVWSLGVVLYAMIAGYFPFQGSSNQDLCRKIVRGRFETPEFMSPDAKDLVRRMLVTDPTKRLPLWHVRQHGWCRLVSTSLVPPTPPRPKPISAAQIESSFDSDDEPGDKSPVVDADATVLEQVSALGFGSEYASYCVTRNLHNLASSSYWLLEKKHRNRQRATQPAAPMPSGPVITRERV